MTVWRATGIARAGRLDETSCRAPETAPGDEELTEDVQRVLGRPARDFADDVRDAVARGVWDPASSGDQP